MGLPLLRFIFFCFVIIPLLSVTKTGVAFSASDVSYDQALSKANKEVKSIGFQPEIMAVEYGTQEVVNQLRRNGGISYNALYSKDWHPFHFCHKDGVSQTCVWVLVSKTDEDVILW